MGQYLNVGKAVVLLLVLGLLLWIGWEFIGYMIAEKVIKTDNYSGANIAYLKEHLGVMGLVYWGVGIVVSAIWLLWSTAAQIIEERDVRSLSVVWFGCLVGGTIVTVIIGYLLASSGLQDARGDVALAAPLVLLLLFLISYWPIGCWWFTKPAALRAVPGAALVRR